jgi:class 3 adenylate cyclase
LRVPKSENDPHGEGVNVAARLEGLADPGGILISATSGMKVRADRAALRSTQTKKSF